MSLSPRRFAPLLLLAGVALVAGCGSNNKGKIIGRWQIVSTPGNNDVLKQLEGFGGYAYFDFNDDGTFATGIAKKNPTPEEKAQEKSYQGMTATFRLFDGNDVEISRTDKSGQGLPGLLGGSKPQGRLKFDQERVKIEIVGDTMKMTGSEGTAELTRVK